MTLEGPRDEGSPPADVEEHADQVRATPPRRRNRITPLGKLVIVLLIILIPLGALAGYVVNASGGSKTGRPVPVVIEPGASASTIAAQLQRAGVIRAAWLFRLYARIHGSAKDLRPGEYEFRTNMSYAAVISILEKGPKIEFTRITIPEGKTVTEIAHILERAGVMPAQQFLAECRSGRHTTSLLPKEAKNLEGVLFPKTYDLKKGITASDVVGLLIHQFESEIAGLDFTKAKQLGVTPYQVLTIASMIEREAKLDVDRPKIARVIYNRLAKGMHLEIDATVEYAIFLKTGAYKNPLLTTDLTIDSPYNTYKIPALPPAPIANPGLASIEAALNPANGTWLYYVLINDKGQHGFATTYAEFQRLKNSRR